MTYKLKLNGGDIKAVQGDSGHSQVSMVTDVYSHIIDEDRMRNAQLFEDAFYNRKDTNPVMNGQKAGAGKGKGNGGTKTVELPNNVDPELLQKVLGNPETAALLIALAKSMQG